MGRDKRTDGNKGTVGAHKLNLGNHLDVLESIVRGRKVEIGAECIVWAGCAYKSSGGCCGS